MSELCLVPEAFFADYEADFKEPPRVRDPEVFKRFHDAGPDCLSCGYTRVHAHHLLGRAQGGDDVLENLIPLCSFCHMALHGNSRTDKGRRIDEVFVRQAIARYLTHESGEDALNYLRSKRSDGWIEKRFGVDLV